MPIPFISRGDLADILGRDVEQSDGALIAVDAACDIVRTLTGQSINAGTTTATFDGPGTDALVLPEYPANTIGTVQVRDSSGTWNTAGAADYALADDGVLIAMGGTVAGTVWPMGRQNVRVNYTHGYADADVPRDIRVLALSVAERIVIQGPMTSETVGGASASYASPQLDLTPGEKAIAAKYRRTRSS